MKVDSILLAGVRPDAVCITSLAGVLLPTILVWRVCENTGCEFEEGANAASLLRTRPCNVALDYTSAGNFDSNWRKRAPGP